MAGGVGSRFWPSSTIDRPKQFLDITGIGKSLIQMTFERCLELVPTDHIFIITNTRYKDLVLLHIPEIPQNNILCEPSTNNTGPSVAYAALRINAINPEAVFAVLPADHVIIKENLYLKLMHQAFDFAASGDVLVTLGIQPTRPDTGYGYINYNKAPIAYEPVNSDITTLPEKALQNIYKVHSFKEKPDAYTASQYLASGDYLWNAGMFIWSVKSIIKSFQNYAPDIFEVLSAEKSHFNTKTEQAYIDKVYPKTKSISIDYAILENAANVYTIPADIGWSDLGTWNSLHAFFGPSGDNVAIGKNINLINTNDLIVMSNNDKIIVIKGLQNYIVVDEENALLIYPKSDEQEIKQVVQQIGL